MTWLVTWLKPYLLPLVAALVLGGAGLGYWAGDHNRNNAWLAKNAAVEKAAHEKYVAEVQRGNVAVGALALDARGLQDSFTNLKDQFNGLSKRVPLLAGAAGSHIACGAGAAGVGGNRLGPLHDGPKALDGSQPAGTEPVLTAGAVWMWNSALTGKDQPAGACSAANTSQAACAVATAITIDDAWRNHTTNAQICAEDRLVHQSLVNFLVARESASQ